MLQNKSDFARECVTDRLGVRKVNLEGAFNDVPIPIPTRFFSREVTYNGFIVHNISIKMTN
jgi:hypothetical protein